MATAEVIAVQDTGSVSEFYVTQFLCHVKASMKSTMHLCCAIKYVWIDRQITYMPWMLEPMLRKVMTG
jgi:hypothetical protein